MIINHNLSAINTLNALGKNTSATSKSLQKLSTGYRINGASDDAAGLAISEKMRGQISGLKQASANAQDGISMLQTAEGGLDQTHSILQRMRELAVQSASDTNTSDDRQKIQSEVDQLAKEISRISNTTEFNTQNLLAGGLSDTFHIGANANQNLSVSITAMDAQTLGVAGSVTTAGTVSLSGVTKVNISNISRGITAATGYAVTVSVTAATSTNVVQTVAQATNAAGLTFSAASGASGGAFTRTEDTNYLVKVASVNFDAGTNTVQSISVSKDNGTSWTTMNGDFTSGVAMDGLTLTLATAASANKYTVGDTYAFSVNASYETYQLKDGSGTNIGASAKASYGATTVTVGDSLNNRTVDLQVNYSAVTAGTLTFVANQSFSTSATVTKGAVLSNASVVAGIDVSTQSAANTAITTINNAITTVSKQRSQIGAYQNRLTNTIDNLNTSNENITASEARIRDVDMSSEMMTYQKNNILQQAATAMLAKANQQPQSVLQLLQG